jgi:hypothetical protein
VYKRVNGRKILKSIFKTWDGGTDWVDMAQDRDKWWALVNRVVNLRVLYDAGVS